VSIFLTELSSRHSVLTKQKVFREKPRIQSNSGKLTNWLAGGTNEKPMVINEDPMDAIVIEEEEDDEGLNLADIPMAEVGQEPRRSARVKPGSNEDQHSDVSGEDLFVPEAVTTEQDDAEQDDKKKMGLNTSYDGFSIYGRILCLVVKRRGVRSNTGGGAPASSQQMLENWVSTQAAGPIEDDEDNS
jgi:hypothetical protein